MDIIINQQLQKVLRRASHQTFDIMKTVNNDNINIRQVHEDGLSSIFLKNLATFASEDYFVKIKSLEVNEPETAMDFDIWIGENDSTYVRLCVQAKSFKNNDDPNKKYSSFELDQCQKLIGYSGCKTGYNNNHKGIPLYFLYQYLKEIFFPFLDDFVDKDVGITITSAKNIESLIEQEAPSFKDIHLNSIEKKWNNFYDLLKNSKSQVALPLFTLADLNPTLLYRFNKLNRDSNSSLGFFFFFFLISDEYAPIDSNIRNIEKYYGNNTDRPIEFKNLVIINDKHASTRERIKRIKEITDNY